MHMLNSRLDVGREWRVVFSSGSGAGISLSFMVMGNVLCICLSGSASRIGFQDATPALHACDERVLDNRMLNPAAAHTHDLVQFERNKGVPCTCCTAAAQRL